MAKKRSPILWCAIHVTAGLGSKVRARYIVNGWSVCEDEECFNVALYPTPHDIIMAARHSIANRE